LRPPAILVRRKSKKSKPSGIVEIGRKLVGTHIPGPLTDRLILSQRVVSLVMV
jgi:hypothetical protein